jgi:DNA-binding NarL/FixJ family response regulator
MKTAIVVEDQPIIWDYVKSCLEGLCEIQAFCSNTEEAEEAFKKYKPDLVWLDCYLGEISECSQGIKNSGILLASWMKKHHPETKIFLFTASNEASILEAAKSLDVEGIALGGKFLRDKEIVIRGIQALLEGEKWLSPNIIENVELDNLGSITVFEFCVICSLLIGKSTAQIAEEMDTTRKRVNNAVYRIKEKFKIEDHVSREELLEILKDKVKSSFNPCRDYNISDVISINSLAQQFLLPVIKQIREGDLKRLALKDL